jgi:hypothetical protein
MKLGEAMGKTTQVSLNYCLSSNDLLLLDNVINEQNPRPTKNGSYA